MSDGSPERDPRTTPAKGDILVINAVRCKIDHVTEDAIWLHETKSYHAFRKPRAEWPDWTKDASIIRVSEENPS